MSESRRTSRTTGIVPLLAAAEPEKAAEALAEKHGAALDKPALRPDAVVRRQVQMGETRWWVKNTETFKHYLFYDFEWRLIELLDGTRTRQEIVDEYNRLYAFDPIDVQVVLDYEEMLRKIGLLAQTAAGRNLELLRGLKTARQRAAEEKAEGFNPFFLLFHVLNPDRFLNKTVRFVRWIWTPPVVVVWSIAVAWTIGVFALHFQTLWTGTYELYAFLRKPLLDAIQFFLLLSIVGCIHEFGHAYAVKIYGGEVRDIGIALLYFTPAFYCDTTDALLFENKWHRLWVNTAGIYIEGFICSAATALWVASYPDTFLHEFAYKTMLFTGISTIFFNINPLIKIDGYHALTSYLEMPDLREDSFRYIGACFQRYVLRLPVEVPPTSRRRRRIFWIYGTLALAYTAVIMRLIGGILYNLFHKLTPDFAVVLLIVALYRIFRKRVRLLTRTTRLFYLDKKELLMARKSRPALIVAAVVVAVLLLGPWTHRTISSEGALRPMVQERIEAPEDGIVSQVLVHEGDEVKTGGPLLRMTSLALDAGAARSSAQRQRFERAAMTARESSQPAAVFENERKESAAGLSIAEATAREERLNVQSPVDGRVLTHRVEDFEGRYVLAGTLLAEVGDCRSLEVDLPVSERRLDELQPGREVRAFVPQRPLEQAVGHIVRVSSASLDQPHTVSGLTDPNAPTEQPERFVAIARFDNPDGTLRPGDVVSAKIRADRTSYAGRAWWVVRRWIQTIVW